MGNKENTEALSKSGYVCDGIIVDSRKHIPTPGSNDACATPYRTHFIKLLCDKFIGSEALTKKKYDQIMSGKSGSPPNVLT